MPWPSSSESESLVNPNRLIQKEAPDYLFRGLFCIMKVLQVSHSYELPIQL